MPIYEYECTEKGHRFDAMQKISDEPLQECKICGGEVRKLISASAFHLKGGGWYKDGYTSTGPSNGSGPGVDKKASSDSKPSTSTKTETKTKGESK